MYLQLPFILTGQCYKSMQLARWFQAPSKEIMNIHQVYSVHSHTDNCSAAFNTKSKLSALQKEKCPARLLTVRNRDEYNAQMISLLHNIRILIELLMKKLSNI